MGNYYCLIDTDNKNSAIYDMAWELAVLLQNEPEDRKRELLDAIYDNSDSRIANLYG